MRITSGSSSSSLLFCIQINNSSFNNGYTVASGGGMYLFLGNSLVHEECYCSISSSSFTGNVATYSGGGLFTTGLSLNLFNTTFYENIAKDGPGGGVHVDSIRLVIMTITFANTSFVRNNANDGGGAYVSFNNASIHIIQSYFESNKATKNGGAISITSDETQTLFTRFSI